MKLSEIANLAETLIAKRYEGCHLIEIKLFDAIPEGALWADEMTRKVFNERFKDKGYRPFWRVIFTDSTNQEHWIIEIDLNGNEIEKTKPNSFFHP